MNSPVTQDRLLVFDCHEAWVYQLRVLEQQMDVVVGLKGRHMAEWDDAMRPVPPNARIVQLDAALRAAEPYYCIIAHNLSDLLDVKTLAGPRLFVIHGTLDGMVSDQQTVTQPDELRRTVAQFIRLIGAHAIAVSKLKGYSWGFDQDIVSFAADPGDYLPYRGDLPRGLRIANSIRSRARTLLWEFHEMAFRGVPMTLVGRNDDMPGVEPAHDWAELKQILSRHRFFVHTADPKLEDGYNMATLEAMAAGLPVVGNQHPSSPVEHGISGFLSNDPAELHGYAMRLLDDRNLAAQMGRAAQKAATEKFAPAAFKAGLMQAIETARRKWREHRQA